jgi:hypothetical protein
MRLDNPENLSEAKRRKGEYRISFMPSANALRIQIEHSLARRFPAALSPAPRAQCETAPTGIPAVDELLGGGLPVGAISEVTGPECSGRTSLALSFLARCTQQAQVCAWVDAEDALDAESAAANGVSLRQLLWVRCRKTAGSVTKPWTQLDQALRVTDLLLQAGGFAAIVLDLGSTAPEHASRIPLATWFRFRQAAGRTRCSLVVLGQDAFAQSSAAVVLECAPQQARTGHQTVLSGFTYEVRRSRGTAAQHTLPISGLRKPPVSTWSTTGAWDAEKWGPQRHVFVAGVPRRA